MAELNTEVPNREEEGGGTGEYRNHHEEVQENEEEEHSRNHVESSSSSPSPSSSSNSSNPHEPSHVDEKQDPPQDSKSQSLKDEELQALEALAGDDHQVEQEQKQNQIDFQTQYYHDNINNNITNSNTNTNTYYEGFEVGFDQIPPFPSTTTNDDDAIEMEPDSIWTKIAAFLWIVTLFYWFYVQSKSEEERQRRAERRRVRRAERAKRKQRLDPGVRKVLISNTIATTRYTETLNPNWSSSSSNDDGNDCNTSTITPTPFNNNDDEDKKYDNNDLDLEACRFQGGTDAPECSICLENFEPTDELSWSKSLKCHHVFHKECVLPWLMTHDECPCCRTVLFEDSDYDFMLSKTKKQDKGEGKRKDNSVKEGNYLDEEGGGTDRIRGRSRSRGRRESQEKFLIVNGLVEIVRQFSSGGSSSPDDEHDNENDHEDFGTDLQRQQKQHHHQPHTPSPTISTDIASRDYNHQDYDHGHENVDNGHRQCHQKNSNSKRKKRKKGKDKYTSISNADEEGECGLDDCCEEVEDTVQHASSYTK